MHLIRAYQPSGDSPKKKVGKNIEGEQSKVEPTAMITPFLITMMETTRAVEQKNNAVYTLNECK